MYNIPYLDISTLYLKMPYINKARLFLISNEVIFYTHIFISGQLEKPWLILLVVLAPKNETHNNHTSTSTMIRTTNTVSTTIADKVNTKMKQHMVDASIAILRNEWIVMI